MTQPPANPKPIRGMLNVGITARLETYNPEGKCQFVLVPNKLNPKYSVAQYYFCVIQQSSRFTNSLFLPYQPESRRTGQAQGASIFTAAAILRHALMDHLRHFLSRLSIAGGKSKWLSTPGSSRYAVPPILGLPLELFLQVLRYLDMHDEYVLGQVCKATRSLTSRDWKSEFAELSWAGRIEFLHGIASYLLDYWVCAPCAALHAIDEDDYPSADTMSARRACQRWEHRNLGQDYRIREMHVQLALKLSRRSNTECYSTYLRNLMSPYSKTYRGHVSASLRRQYTARPRIIDSSFLLQIDWEFCDGGKPITYPELIGICLCPHLEIQVSEPYTETSYLYYLVTRFERHARLAFEYGMQGREVTGYCRHCPTDYAIIVTVGYAAVRVWHDFGSHKPPNDKGWRMHVRPGHLDRTRYGPAVYREGGSVREKYFKKRTT